MGRIVAWVQALLGRWRVAAAGRSAWLLAAVLLSVALLILPVPALLLDVLLLANLALAVALCAAAASAGEPLRLPELPALLLVSVLLRLGLNVAALRLILGGVAGNSDSSWLLGATGSLLGGDALIGVPLILILGAVEYLVLARGGERVAEVAARFVLDALPGRQSAIEADLRSGSISLVQAQERRSALDREAQIYGALDGALRLLRGDAVAALLILATGLIGGLLVGALRQGLPLAEAAERCGLLIVGQGLLTQIPGLLNSAAAGLLITGRRTTESRESTSAIDKPAPALLIEADAALGLDAAALKYVQLTLSTRLGFAVPALELRTTAGTLRGLSVRLHGAPLWTTSLASEVDVRAALAAAILPAAADLLTIDIVQNSLDALQNSQPALLRETVPRRIDLGRLTALLRRLLAQRVWPLDVRAVLETLATLTKLEADLDALTEQVRAGLGRFLIQGRLRSAVEGGTISPGQEGLPALLLSNEIEELLRESRRERPSRSPSEMAVEPELLRDIVQGVLSAKKLAPDAILLCHADVRRAVEQMLSSAPDALPVLAYSEVPATVSVVVMGRVEPGSEHTAAFVDSAAVPWQMRSH